ncbi:MAG: AI-2E family transporter [Pseudomonadota bacterium]|nr:AI-2E family transporter [Pseudomonadota bacterium]
MSRTASNLLFIACFLAMFLTLCFLYQAVLLDVALALLLYFLFGSLVDYLDHKLRIPRALAISAVIVLVLAGIGVVSAYFAPIVYTQIMSIIQSIPNAVNKITYEWLPIIKSYVESLGMVDAQQIDLWWREVKVTSQATSQLQQAVNRIWSYAPSLFDALLHVVLVPIIAFFLLNNPRRIREKIALLIPRSLLPHATRISNDINATLRSVLNGQAMVALVLAVLYVIGFSIVGLKAAIAVGLVAGVFRLVPYFDLIVGVMLSALLIISDFPGWGQVIGVGIVIAMVQALDAMIITPRIMGNSTGIHPLLIILSVLSFGSLFGFWGILFAIPTIATVKVLVIQLLPIYQKSRLYDPSN